MWPKAAWKSVYEPNIRSAAGLGVAPDQPDPDHYSARYAHCEVLVLGGGAAGIAAALAAAETRRARHPRRRAGRASAARCASRAAPKIDGQDGWTWAQTAAARLAGMDNVRVLPRTTAFGYYAQNFVGLVERVSDHLADPGRDAPRERLWQVRAKRVVLATGAIERHMVFADNDRPGIMLAAAARTYLNHYGVAVGHNVGVYTANDSAYARGDRPEEGRRQDRGDRRPARRRRRGRRSTRRAALGIEIHAGRAVIGAGGKLRVSSMTVAAEDRRRRAHDRRSTRS